MRAEISRNHIANILNSLDEYETENDKIKTAQFLCKFVFSTDILFDQYGEHDKDFNNFFGEKLMQFYKQYPEQFSKYMAEYETFLEDVESDYDSSYSGSDSSYDGNDSIEYV